MNYRGYFSNFGDKDFSEFAFNEVDAAYLAVLSYPNWELYAPMLDNPNAEPFSFSQMDNQKIKELAKATPDSPHQEKFLKLALKSKRYKNIKVKYIENKRDLEKRQMYFALTFEIPGVGDYVCFRGTDISILAWEENLNISLNIVTPSQSDSLDYLQKVSKLIDGDFYVGGHSKGGNLSIYSSMNVPVEIQERIIKIFSFDGCGFYKNDFYYTDNYKRIKDKIYQIVPTDSFVGVIFFTPKDYKIVSSRYLSVLQHLPYSWRLHRDGTFKLRKHRTYMSHVRHRALRQWVDHADNATKALTVDSIVTCLGGRDKDLTLYIKHPDLIMRTMVLWHKKYTKEQKKIIRRFTRQLIKAYFRSFFYLLSKKHRRISEEQ